MIECRSRATFCPAPARLRRGGRLLRSAPQVLPMSMSISSLDTGAGRAEAARMQQLNNAIIQQASAAENVESAIFSASVGQSADTQAALAEGIGNLVDVTA